MVQGKERIKRGMKQVASYYTLAADLFSLFGIRRAHRKILKEIDSDQLQVLGGGDGSFLRPALTQFERIRFIELSEDMIHRAQRKLKSDEIEWIEGDVLDTVSLEDGSTSN